MTASERRLAFFGFGSARARGASLGSVGVRTGGEPAVKTLLASPWRTGGVSQLPGPSSRGPDSAVVGTAFSPDEKSESSGKSNSLDDSPVGGSAPDDLEIGGVGISVGA